VSLLLEALKKAELAKQGNKAASTAPTAIELAPSANDKPVITREHLPDITQQLEILSEDLPSSNSSSEAAPMPQPQNPPPPPAAPEPIFADEPVADQAVARQVFEAKGGLEDYNPRKPFYYTVGALGVFAACTIGYFWWQLQPRYIVAPSAVANAPARPPEPVAPPAAAVATQSTPDPLAGPGPGLTAPGVPGPAAATPDSTPGPVQARQVMASKAPPPTMANPSTAAASVTSANSPVVITRSTPVPEARTSTPPRTRQASGARAPAINSSAARTDQQLEQAYDAYQKGDLATARQSYLDALKSDPANRDALLGLAAIEARSGQLDIAEARYLKLLEADPRDAHALAGLLALRGQADPVQSESRLKSLIASQPEAGFLHFALGNQMALQARWPEAQASYFKAFSNEPENPDYAYNLAVSLDHLRQSKLALDYYQKALTLGGTRPSTFDRARATTRIRELQQ
jgi:Tfp pilus assembly protein PilF